MDMQLSVRTCVLSLDMEEALYLLLNLMLTYVDKMCMNSLQNFSNNYLVPLKGGGIFKWMHTQSTPAGKCLTCGCLPGSSIGMWDYLSLLLRLAHI